MLTHFILNMQQRAKVTIDNDDDYDDDDDVKQEITETIEKFVQNRHVQTLKYLRHVIDENRHLRLHIEHLQRRQDDPDLIVSPATIDPIDSEESPITEIPVVPPESEVISIRIYSKSCFKFFRLRYQILFLIIMIKQQILMERISKRNITH